MNRVFAKILVFALAALVIASCSSTKKVVYLQDLEPEVSLTLKERELIRFEPGDRLRIVVHSRDAEIVRVFNLLDNSGQGNGHHSPYTIDQNGYIDMPVLGTIKIAGLTREETINEIKYKLLEMRLVKDPIVTIEYEDLCYYIIGEVSSRGRKTITKDHITLLEAIADAGDLTIDGRRDNVLVLRTVNGRQTPYRVNLLETESLYSSPVFYLQQDDIIYVEPNKKRKNSASVNAGNLSTPSFWMSLVSFALSLLFIFVARPSKS